MPIILKAMDDLEFKVHQNQGFKEQALNLIEKLPEVLPIERAKIRVKITCPSNEVSNDIQNILSEKYDKNDNQ